VLDKEVPEAVMVEAMMAKKVVRNSDGIPLQRHDAVTKRKLHLLNICL